MPKKTVDDVDNVQNGASASVSASASTSTSVNVSTGLGKNKKRKSKDASRVEEVAAVAVTTSAQQPAQPKVTVAASSALVTNGFDPLMPSLSNGTGNIPGQMTVRLPTSSDSRMADFDVARFADDGSVVVHKLSAAITDESLALKKDETFLKPGDRITGVHISLAPLKFEESVRLLNAILPFKPELFVKSEPDWMASLQSLSEPSARIGSQSAGNCETPKLSTAQPSKDSSVNREFDSTEA